MQPLPWRLIIPPYCAPSTSTPPFCSLLQHRNTFYSPPACRRHGKPTSSSWNSPGPRGSQDLVGSGRGGGVTNQCTANGEAELFTGSGRRSLLCSASIKGNSAEDFLVGVMRPTITQKLALKHRQVISHASTHELGTLAHLSKG